MKSKVISLIVFLSVCLVLSGCAGQCIKVGGEWKGVSGDVSYCFSGSKSAETGVPAFEISYDAEGGLSEYLYGFDLPTLEGIRDALKKTFGLSAKSRLEQKHPAQEILEMVESSKLED